MYYWKGKREQNHHVYSECCHWAPLGDLKLNNAGRNINCTGLRKEQQGTLDWKRELCRLPSASQSFAGTLINRVLLIQKFHSNASLFSVGLQQLQICHWQLRVISCFWVCRAQTVLNDGVSVSRFPLGKSPHCRKERRNLYGYLLLNRIVGRSAPTQTNVWAGTTVLQKGAKSCVYSWLRASNGM